jgi:signal transduction histidine kinase/CheY-like chemotaxis protein
MATSEMKAASFADRTNWIFPALLFLSVVLPGALFVWMARAEHQHVFGEAERTAERTVSSLLDHALKVFETHELIIEQVEARIHGRSWDDIEGDRSLQEILARTAARFDQVHLIGVADSDGQLRLVTTDVPLEGHNVADRDYFQSLSNSDADTYISAVHQSRLTGEDLITLSRRRVGPNGSFDGITFVSAPLTYFTTFWEQVAPEVAHIVPLVRADGQIIARFPALNNPERLDVAGPFLSRALVEPRGTYTAVSLVDGVERLNSYSQIDGFPLFISFSVETRALRQEWRNRVYSDAILTLLASMALLAGAVMAWRQFRAQEAASRRWQVTADELSAEMARREAAEATLRQAQKMESLGQLTGGIAHDFNNLLMAVLTSLEMLKKRIATEDRRAMRLIDNALRGAERGAALTQRLLSFARRQELNPAATSIPHVIDETLDLLQGSLGSHIKTKTRISDQTPKAWVDANQLEAAILNLALNARDAMPQGGTLTLEVDEVTVEDDDALPKGPFVRIRVSDTGTGMDEETLQRATEPFFTTKGIGSGTGLGLAMVHGLAAQSGGRFQLKSEPGRGTTAELLLPASQGQSAGSLRVPTEGTADTPNDGQGRLSILVVDDDPLVLASAVAMLEELNHSPIPAMSGAEALAILRSGQTVDIVVADQMMPNMTGTQLAAAIRPDHPGVPVLLATGFAEISEGKIENIVGRLSKPFGQSELASALIRAVGERA